MTPRPLLAALAAALVLAAGVPAYAKPSPEGDKGAKPGEDAGYHLGYPSPTAMWHGCDKTSSQLTPADQDLDEGVPAQPEHGSKQTKVTWTVTGDTSSWQVDWKVADGWTICGAEAAVLGTDPASTFDLAMQAGFTSQRGGGTAKSGAQGVTVQITKSDCKEEGIDPMYAGNWSIVKIYSITVYVKKKK